MAENVDILGEVFMTDEFVGKYVKFSEEYQQLSDKETEIYNKMRTVLTGEELELFEKFVDTAFDRIGEECDCFFRSGLKTGFRLAVELNKDLSLIHI